ncbi:MAG: hypothetical protein IKE92_04650 [Clostridiales bacterium]|nr:hypothetical protein [Clostridiales bacterium]
MIKAEWTNADALNLQPTCNQLATDCISRQAAIDALSNGALVNYQAAGHNNGLVKAIDVIKGLPSAQPERKWVPVREELPREYGLYLVTTCKGNVYLWTYKPEMKEIWKRFVSAWCYLPAPYEE